MIKTIKTFAAAALVLAASACTKLDGVNGRIDSLDSRITALETQVKALNGNIDALKTIAGGGFINKVEEKDGVYTLTMCNGEKIVLNQGSIGVGKTPQMSISEDGYWMVDYQDGQGAQPVKDGEGKTVPAVGKDGVTPVFSVDAQNYWTVSYDEGKTFAQVLDADGNPVKAISGGTGTTDSYFKDVTYDNETFTLTLKNGESYVVAIKSSFFCGVKNVVGIQIFENGQTKVYDVEMLGVVDATVTAPAGWKASLSTDNKLSITAPAATKVATYIADSKADVSILAVSNQGLAAITKVRVQISGGDEPVNPVATIAVTETLYNSLTFAVTTAEVSSWKYIFQSSTTTAPTQDQLISGGTTGTSETLKFDNLTEKTGYTLYVLPINDKTYGKIASKAATTPVQPAEDYTDNYQAYCDGNSINIAGVKYNKSEWGDAVLLTANSANTLLANSAIKPSKKTIYFLECATGANFVTVDGTQYQLGNNEVAFVGRYPASRAKVTATVSFVISNSFAIKDIELDLSPANTDSKSYKFAITMNKAPLFHIDRCFIKPFTANNAGYSTNVPASFRMVNCDVKTDAAQVLMWNMSASTNMNDLKDVDIENNIFYTSNVNGNLFIIGCNKSATAAAQTGVPGGEKLVFANNTFINFISVSGNYDSMISLGNGESVTMQKNIFKTGNTAGGVHRTLKFLTYPANPTLGPDVYCANLPYSNNWRYLNNAATPVITRTTSDPFEVCDPETWQFVPVEAYADYGAQRK